jgi:hypothetical protein
MGEEKEYGAFGIAADGTWSEGRKASFQALVRSRGGYSLAATLATMFRLKRVGDLHGAAAYGPTIKARFIIGLTAGITYGTIEEGEKLKWTDAATALVRLRRRYIRLPGATITKTIGFYLGDQEKSLVAEVIFMYDKLVKDGGEESEAQFVESMKRIAQDLAAAIAQREVIIEWYGGTLGQAGTTDTYSPTGAPPKHDASFSDHSKALYARWVRQHSKRARTKKSDDCHISKHAKGEAALKAMGL